MPSGTYVVLFDVVGYFQIRQFRLEVTGFLEREHESAHIGHLVLAVVGVSADVHVVNKLAVYIEFGALVVAGDLDMEFFSGEDVLAESDELVLTAESEVARNGIADPEHGVGAFEELGPFFLGSAGQIELHGVVIAYLRNRKSRACLDAWLLKNSSGCFALATEIVHAGSLRQVSALFVEILEGHADFIGIPCLCSYCGQ